MSVLENFPMVSQRTPITSDGRPSENAEQDCVEASVGAAILWYQKKKQWDKDINPDMLLGSAYPEGYTGGTAAVKLVPICQKLGFKLYPYDGIPGQLVSEAHRQLSLKHPVIFTEPDPYANPSLGWSHVCVFYADTPGFLTAMDPYPLPGTNTGHAVYKSDAEWMNRLLFNQIWIVEPMEVDVPKIITIHDVSSVFEELDASHWRCKQTDKIIQYGILSAYKAYGNGRLCGFSHLGLPESNELPLQGVPGAVKQHFERGVLCYDPAHKIDNPPGWDAVYPMHLYNGGPGQDPVIAQLQKQIADLQAKQPQDAQRYLDVINKVKADLAGV